MSLAKKNTLTLAIGALVLLTSIFIFSALSHPKELIDRLAFASVLFAETISIAGFLVFNKAGNNSSGGLFSAGAYAAIFQNEKRASSCSKTIPQGFRRTLSVLLISWRLQPE